MRNMKIRISNKKILAVVLSCLLLSCFCNPNYAANVTVSEKEKKEKTIFWKSDSNENEIEIDDRSFSGRRPFSRKLQDSIIVALQNAEQIHRALPKKIAEIKLKLENSRPIKDEFELTEKFNVRVATWNKEVEKLNFEIESYYSKLGPLPLSRRASAFEEAIRYS